jgi:malectin (di-glucose binding ER protein)
VSLNPSTVIGGSAPITGTVTLNGPAPTGGISVSLSSGNPLAATVGGSVLVLANATSATFSVTSLAVSAKTSVVITASSTLNGSATATLSVNPAASAVTSVSLNPTNVVGGVTNSTGTVTLNGGAPTNGAVVTLSSTNGAAAAVPLSVTVLAGATTATFTVTTGAVTSSVTPTITAMLNTTSATATVTVNPLTVISLSIVPASVTGSGVNSTATVTLNSPAPLGGASVALLNGTPAAATVPVSVTVAGGATTATFIVTSKTVTVQTATLITATLNGSATATLTVNPPPSFTPIRVHAGGAAYTDTQGNLWSADTKFSGGKTYTATVTITNTTDQTLYKSERYGAFSYKFTVPNGSHTVTLKFAEIFYTSPGERIFSVAINGTTVLSNFDIVAKAGAADKAFDQTFPVNVTGGTVTIQFITGSVDLPKISAIQIQ